MDLPEDVWRLWGKTPGLAPEADAEGTWLALHQHLRDSADVGMELAERWLSNALFQRLNRIADGEVQELVGFLAGTHDLGKAQLRFQAQVRDSPLDERWRHVQGMRAMPDLALDDRIERDHAVHSDAILFRCLQRFHPKVKPRAISSMTSITGCHHGKPSGLGAGQRTDSARHRIDEWLIKHGTAWENLWITMIDDIVDRTGSAEVLARVLERGGLSAADQLMLSGLVTMADWIASNQQLFPLTVSGRVPGKASRAEGALNALNLTTAWVPHVDGEVPFRERFGWRDEAELRQAQLDVVRIAGAIGAQPALMIVEAETGSGKTEAALLAAEIQAANIGSGGVAFALPTMATADAMFARVQTWVRSTSADDDQLHSLFLGHSRAALNQDYADLVGRTRSIASDTPEQHLDVVAHQWLSGRRRGLLSEFVVCTVDQILMCALATKYVTLRHLGLAGKVVVIDEVHAYDVYSTSYMHRALMWLGAHGAPVILLSATLSAAQRRGLESSYAQGLEGHWGQVLGDGFPWDETAEPTEPEVEFPRVTVVTRDGSLSEGITAPEGHRKAGMRLIGDELSVLCLELEPLEREGGVVGIVCNTVRRAQEVYGQLCRRFPEDSLELLHSQFTAADRADREQGLVRCLGPDSHRGDGRPQLRIVVGTQVLEQSLDIDFDLLITDLAPVDSLAQRAGRLHRHQRPDEDRPNWLSAPMMLIRGVDATGDVPVFDKGSTAIYGDRVLLATMHVLAGAWRGEPWCLRHDVPPAVEAVYSSDLTVPAAWAGSYSQARAEEQARSDSAQRRACAFQLSTPSRSDGKLNLALKNMLDQDADRIDSAAQAHVRDIEPTLEVLLVQRTSGGILRPLPWVVIGEESGADYSLDELQPPPELAARAVAGSAVRLSTWLVRPDEASFSAALDELERRGIPGWQQHYLLKGQLVLEVDDDLQGVLGGRRFQYDRSLGLSPVRAKADAEVA